MPVIIEPRILQQEVLSRPTRPLSSYNIYYQVERQRILNGVDHIPLTITPEEVQALVLRHKNRPKRAHKKTHGKIGFRALNAMIAARWKELRSDVRAVFEYQAKIEKSEYLVKLNAWKEAESTVEGYAHSMAACAVKNDSFSTYNGEGTAPSAPIFPTYKACKSVVGVEGLMALRSLATTLDEFQEPRNDTVVFSPFLDEEAPFTKSIFDSTPDPSTLYVEDFDGTNLLTMESVFFMSPEEMDHLFD